MVRVGVWEAVYLIQGLLDQQSKVKPSQVHTDTQGQVLPNAAPRRGDIPAGADPVVGPGMGPGPPPPDRAGAGQNWGWSSPPTPVHWSPPPCSPPLVVAGAVVDFPARVTLAVA